jgi:hypothetical protein
MRTTFKICSPDEIQATLTVTMTVKEWRELRTQLVDSWPSWQLSRDIGDVIRQAEKTFYANTEAEE